MNCLGVMGCIRFGCDIGLHSAIKVLDKETLQFSLAQQKCKAV